MTSPAGPPPTGSSGDTGKRLKLLAVTACPTGIAHTYMAAEKLQQAAESRGIEMKVETQGSIGAENVLDDNDVSTADGVIVAADKDVDLSRFVGKRVLKVGVAEGIHHPERLIEQVRSAPVHTGAATASATGGRERSVTYKALMNGVSYMIPFVVVGGLLIAISLSLGGHTDPSGGLVIPEDSFWMDVNNIGVIGFTLMVPILSGYIAYAIGDRPALVPGMIGGWIANTGALYDSKAGAGFIGAIVTGFCAGYLVLGIKKVRVPKFVQPIMPIIVIPMVATTALGLFFIYVVGRPISWVFEHLTDWLSGMTGTSAVLLGALLGLMIAFDMGGPVNKTAFLFGAGLIASGNQTVMGMCAAAIPVMPLGQGLATLVRKRLYSEQERETGLAALFMGCFGISEGAIPFAAARPAQVIPANMLGGAVAGAVAGLAGVEDAVPHGGPIVAVLGAVSGVPMFFVAVVIGSVVTALTTVALVEVRERGRGRAGAVTAPTAEAPGGRETVPVGVGAGAGPADAVVTRGAAAAVADGADAARAGAREVTAADDTPRQRCPVRDPHRADRPGPAGCRRQGGGDTGDGGAAGAQRSGRGRRGAGADGTAPRGAGHDRPGRGDRDPPHAKTDAVTAPVVGFARSDAGVEWGSLDGTKARLVFMIAVPEAAAGDEHLRILALLSRKLMDTGFRRRLLEAADEAAALAVLHDEVG
ncbi:hypothetical protein GCM10020256_47110 [Streptomyces thermocoprophilus]